MTERELQPEQLAGVDALARLVRGRRVAVLTGAGMSTDSGIPDYRGDGSSPRRQPMTVQRFVGSEAARKRYWAGSALGWVRVDRAQPNAGHLALAALERAGGVVGVATQNVDSLHARAGTNRVVELHGSLRTVSCLACGGVLKPDVVFFGEFVRAEDRAAAEAIVDEADVLLSAGTSLVVNTGRRLVHRARRDGKPIAIVNRGETAADAQADLRIEGGTSGVLAALAARLAVMA